MSNQFPVNGHSSYFQGNVRTNGHCSKRPACTLFLFVEVYLQNTVKVSSGIARYKNKWIQNFGTPCRAWIIFPLSSENLWELFIQILTFQSLSESEQPSVFNDLCFSFLWIVCSCLCPFSSLEFGRSLFNFEKFLWFKLQIFSSHWSDLLGMYHNPFDHLGVHFNLILINHLIPGHLLWG